MRVHFTPEVVRLEKSHRELKWEIPVNSSGNKRIMNPGRAGLVVLSALLLLLGVSSLSCTTQLVAPSQQLKIVTTSNIAADWMGRVGGDRVDVFAVLPVGTDPHTFQPGAGDVARVAEADLIFTVGLGLEGAWLRRLLENAAADSGRVVALGEFVDPLAGEEEEEEQHEHGPFDPHFWWDPLRVKEAVNEVARRLAEADATGAETYSRNAASYQQELDRLHTRIMEGTSQIPLERRKLVTSHETMNYFAQRYGFEAVGAVFPGISTEREPSPAELAELVRQVRELGVPAIFTETIVSDRLARAIASETGVEIVRLYSDSLGPPGSGADTFIAMMDTNVEAIVQALK
ncbi:MAG: zinc ABC transporter substrate-binding protein [Chloroflexi bacterium]|nr:zinc ABC transporter substrate-binding protein [Chloroflexota bacterium]